MAEHGSGTTRRDELKRKLTAQAVEDVDRTLAEVRDELHDLASTVADGSARQLACALLERLHHASHGIELVAQLAEVDGSPQPATFCLRELLAELERMCRWVMAPADVNYVLPGVRVSVCASRDEIRHLMLDVLLSVSELLSSPASVSIEVGVERRFDQSMAAPLRARVSIASDGLVLDRETVAALFEPGGRHAPNLWSARDALRRLDGDLTTASVPGRGVQFRVDLPAVWTA